MIIIDTNIMSEMMKFEPSTNVLHWIDQQEITQLFVTTVTIAEISYGLDILPKGKRKTTLVNAFDSIIDEAFKYRVLPFDITAAHHYGKIMGQRKKDGHPLSVLDGQICAIAYVHKAAIATRNMRDFIDCNIDIINPFESA